MISWSALFSQLRVGDPGVIFDTTKLDSDYPQMERWISAGVRAGIPFMDSLEVIKTLEPTNSSGLIAAINELAGSGGGTILLKNGEYKIDKQVAMKSNVSLLGESREGVVCRIYMNNASGFYFGDGIHMSGIYNLTIEGSWGRPKYDWNIGSEANGELPDNENVSVKFVRSIDCWLDKVSIINSADFPMRCEANHTTFRDLIVDGCFNKNGGAHGYFFITDSLNLITACYITRLRHISIQGDGAGFNVFYDNLFEQEISFHSGDDGNNLIEQNIVILPADMPGAELPNYYAIMGPWSIQHTLSKHPNYLYKNQCLELNNGHKGATPWSDTSVIYYGPHYIRPEDPLTNFTPLPGDKIPDGRTLYPVTGVSTGETIRPDFPPELSFFLPDKYFFVLEENVEVELKVRDNDSLSSVELYLDDQWIDTRIHPPFKWGTETAAIQNLEIGKHTFKARATDSAGQFTERSFVFEVVDPDAPLTYTETFDKMTLEGWGQETFTGNYDFVWNLDCKGINGDIDGKGIYFHNGKTGIVSDSITGGIASFSVKCLDKWSEGIERVIDLIINDTVRGSMKHTGLSVYEFKVDSINIPGKFIMAIRNASDNSSNNTVSFDDISWTSFTPVIDTTTIDTTTIDTTTSDTTTYMHDSYLYFDENQEFTVYPNPFTHAFSIQNNTMDSYEAELYNMLGEMIYSRTCYGDRLTNMEPLSSIAPKGLYILKLSNFLTSRSILIIRLQ